MPDDSTFTRGQLERTLSQRIQALYRTQLGHKPTKIDCQICDDKISIVLEDSITKPEQLLAENGQEELAKQVRSELNDMIQVQLKELLEEVLKIPVLDLLTNAKLDTGRTGTIVVLERAPQFRERPSTTPAKKESS
ncbi:MAG TPA: DUF2294 domain-containing protein [Halomicronema sp.]